ncbi:MAG: NYN domain-containing protein [Planctomycetota bacterium]|jgi:predicted RNA-binding protein with PIN domain
MSLLIDGYNLLSAVGILGRGVGPGSLERARLALLNFLAESLDPHDVPRTTVVFDAADPPAGLPRSVGHRGLTVRFASQYEDADALIEELIRADSAPRRLTVVSSDHRLQRAARRRKARFVDSDVWYGEIVRRREQRRQSAPEVPARQLIEEESADQPAPTEQPAAEEPPIEQTAPDKPTADQAAEIGNPFPPGYAEDLLEDDLLEDDEADDPQEPLPP